jgi:hypothetical protein
VGVNFEQKVRLQTGDKGHLAVEQVWNIESIRIETGIFDVVFPLSRVFKASFNQLISW